ncbi:gamma-glutamyltransferase [Bacteroidota bacterium]|nr:gamma-glutamyltransferase [Bacteroidota bacterium]|tara:strand:- start:1841 stop:3529 length:1689 start_codon:yes stop_codon:yes gene_type:complete
MNRYLILLIFLISSIFGETIHRGKVVEANNSMVVTRHFLATEIGNNVLQNGGNAIDASIAISFALAVVLPQAGNIGGGGFMVIHNEDSNFTIDYREQAPLQATEKMFITDGSYDPELALESYQSSGTPGAVAGMYLAHQKFGSIEWKDLIQPSIDLARNGFIVTKTLEHALENNIEKLKKFEATRKIFFKHGMTLRAGDRLIQKDLANTLELIAINGQDGFYRGRTAQLIEQDMFNNNGLMSQKDLSLYQAKMREPIEFTYKDLDVITMPPASSGGLMLALMLNMIENLELDNESQSPQNILKISEVMQIAYSLRSVYLGDSDFYDVPFSEFLSKDKAKELLSNVNFDNSTRKEDFQPEKFKFKENTTHFSVIDKYGNAVSNTTTLNTAFGSGVVIEGTGILMNNEMDDFSSSPGIENYFLLLGNEANKIEPLKRPLSSMTPTIVLREGKPFIITGAQGGSRIITAVLHIILNYYEFKMSAKDAVYANRYHHQWNPDVLMYEFMTNELQNNLEKLGFKLYLRPANYDYSNGITSSIMIEDNKIIGVSDPRSDDYLAIGISND